MTFLVRASFILFSFTVELFSSNDLFYHKQVLSIEDLLLYFKARSNEKKLSNLIEKHEKILTLIREEGKTSYN
ncbi:MAG: hypothetical protein ChlgKO_03460 [Chlamydiales bacterium]